jgi:gliding motility-associated-like protein
VINTATNTVIALVSVGLHPYGVAISPDGTKVYVSNNAENTISVISSATNTVIATITTPIDGSPTGLSVSPDGSFLYVMNYVFNDVSIINTSTNAIVATIPVGAGPQSQGNFVSSGALCTGPSMTFTITVDPGPPTITTTIATGTISACIGAASATPNIQQFTVSGSGLTGNITAAAPTGFEISLVAGSGYGSSIVLAQTGGAVKGTIVYVRSAASLPGGTTTANVLLSSPGAPNQTVSIAATVNPLVTPSLAIAPSVNNICAGTPVTFTATPTNGGISPVYQWLLNGNNTGTNSTTFSSSALANGDVVSCVMTSNATCVTPATATSNGITMNVTAIVTPSISIAASQNNICAGTAVTFTATAANGGSTPVYQWLVNGINAGTNSTTFSSSDFADGDIVSCVMTGNAACAAPASVTSNSINISVNPLVSPAISIAASQNNICPGTNVTFMATPSNGGSAPVYQWLLNGNNIGINSPTFASSTLSNGDIISCRLTGNATCLTIADATSNSLTMIVNAQAVPTVSITTSANGVCAGTPVTFTASPANGGSSPVYQWLLNGNGIGTNSAIFSSSAFANGDVVSCMMTSSLACATPASVTSNNIILNISPLPIVSGGGNKTIEKGSSVALTATASGNIADITWNPVTGLDNNKILNPKASPASTTIYTVTVQTAAGCAATDSVTVTVLYGISIPNTFTPNGDGVNDKWDIQNLKDYQNCVVSIYDRYGGEVYTSKGYYNAWDGTIKGRPCPVGTYYYLINLNNGTPPLSGFVALIR